MGSAPQQVRTALRTPPNTCDMHDEPDVPVPDQRFLPHTVRLPLCDSEHLLCRLKLRVEHAGWSVHERVHLLDSRHLRHGHDLHMDRKVLQPSMRHDMCDEDMLRAERELHV